jgi:enoyl-[acyl-carrier-protein] reductase (NADH)
LTLKSCEPIARRHEEASAKLLFRNFVRYSRRQTLKRVCPRFSTFSPFQVKPRTAKSKTRIEKSSLTSKCRAFDGIVFNVSFARLFMLKLALTKSSRLGLVKAESKAGKYVLSKYNSVANAARMTPPTLLAVRRLHTH